MKNKYEFVKIPDENGNEIVVKRFTAKIGGEKIAAYFEPLFVVTGDKIVRNDYMLEAADVVGRDSKGFSIATKEDFKNYARKKFTQTREEALIIPYAIDVLGKKEPQYPDREITSLKFHLR